MATQADLLRETDLVQTRDAVTMTRVYHVTELTETGSQARAEALAAGGIPSINSTLTLSAIGVKLKVVERSARILPKSPSQAHVTVKYSTPDTARGGSPLTPEIPSFAGGVMVTQHTTNVDRHGVPITVTHNGETQNASVTFPAAEASIEITRIESGIIPGDVGDAYSGKSNATPWNGKPAGWWMCMGVRFVSPDGGETWEMHYSFARALRNVVSGSTVKAVAWNPVAVYIDPQTGRPPAGLIVNQGVKEVDEVETAEFNDLGFF